jgi:beta-glucuronidase
MEKKAGNFTQNIHDEEYEKKYLYGMASVIINDTVRQKESLNGFWNFQIDQYDTCIRSKWYEESYKNDKGRYQPVDYSFDSWRTIRVPSCWNTQDERFYYYEGPAVYTRKFRYENRGEQRVFIKFGAVNYEAKVFLNRKYVGMHRGGSTPFYLEVTGLLEEMNRILVVADNTRKAEAVPAKNTDWFNYGGIYRDVEILRLPETFIRDFYVGLVPNTGFQQIKAELVVDGTQKDGEAVLEIPGLGIKQKLTVASGKAEAVLNAPPELWSPENPRLYDIKLTYLTDCVTDRIGFREIKTSGTRVFLNGKQIFLKGISAHEESVPNGKAVTEEEICENFRLAKEMNCNFMRLAHYPHTDKAARLADQMGIMLWEEIPVYWAIDFSNPQTYENAENQLTELILRDRNRASVIIWSVGNENADTDERLHFMSRLAVKAKQLDASRLVSAACLVNHTELMIQDRLADFLDIIGINEYYGWYAPDFNDLVKLLENSNPAKPVVITEFGADALKGARGTADDMGTEDCQLDIYRKQTETLRKIPYIQGTSPWILFDFRCPRRTSALQGEYNRKGLLNEDKTYKKPAFEVMKRFYELLQDHGE